MDLRIKKTHENLQNALLKLLKTKSLEDISVAELCRLATINRGTFYLHYKNVHGVFERYFNEIVNDLRLSYEFPYDVTRQNISELTPEMIQIFHHVKKYEAFYRIVFDEQIPMTYYHKLFSIVRSFIRSSQSLHDTPFSEKQSDYFVSFTANSIIGIIIQWHYNDFEETPEQLNNFLMQCIQFKELNL